MENTKIETREKFCSYPEILKKMMSLNDPKKMITDRIPHHEPGFSYEDNDSMKILKLQFKLPHYLYCGKLTL